MQADRIVGSNSGMLQLRGPLGNRGIELAVRELLM
jgi:hypothetical protein